MTSTLRLLPCLATLGFLACSGGPTGPADLILINGHLVTLDEQAPTASALAARQGRIIAVGTDEEVRAHAGETTRVIDLEGRLAIPGFIEGHGHFTGIGRSLATIDLSEARTYDEVVARVARASAEAEPDAWILGWGWHQEKWEAPPDPAVEGYPTHEALSRAVPDHPVLLKHAAGSHAGLVNARAMQLAGIDRETPDPPGGRILRDARGDPTGVLRERAYGLALATYERARDARSPEVLEREARREIERANRECLAKGITSFQDAGSDFDTIKRLKAMADEGLLGVRLWVMLSEPNDVLERELGRFRMIGAADGHLTVRAIKRSADGALGSHGAWLLEPYSDRTDSTGHNTYPLEQLEQTAELAIEHNFQLCVHAIGDRANREVLDLYERMFRLHPGRLDLRWRIEHAQHLQPEDVPRFAQLGVVASMQGVHCTSDGPWVPRRLGAARSEQGAYVWRKLIDSGARVINGTDAPVEDVDPIANFHASVTRLTGEGRAFHPEQRMTRVEALRSYTIDAAYAAFEEALKGSLTVGKYADVTVLSRDILEVPDEEIRGTEVLYTIVGGAVRHEKQTRREDAVIQEARRYPAARRTRR